MHYKTGNSIKKTIALSFLFLANAMILTHATISHHHLDTIIPVLLAIHDDSQPDGHCNDLHCHGGIEDCTLSTIYIKFNNDKQVFQSFDFNFNLVPFFLTLLPDYSKPAIIIDIGLPFRQKPYLSSYHTEYISQSAGLRAPPLFQLGIKN